MGTKTRIVFPIAAALRLSDTRASAATERALGAECFLEEPIVKENLDN
jgi:hypothetical protein